MRKIIDVNNWSRNLAYNTFSKYDDSYTGVVTNLDVTNLVNNSRKYNLTFYGSMVYMILYTMNEIEEFKYGYGNFDGEQKIYKFDDIAATMTVIDKNNNLNFTRYVKFDNNFNDFILTFNSATEDASNCLPYYKIDGLEYCNKINITCIPWIKFSNFKDAINFKEKSSKPKICWDKFEKNENRYFLNFSILVNHAFQDGYHIGTFVNQLQENINNFIFDKNILNGGQYAKRRKIY